MPPEGGMMPPEGGMMPPEGGMDPEVQRIYQDVDSMSPEMQQAELSKIMQEALRGDIEEAAGQEADRSIQNVENATGFRDLMNAVWDDEADVEAYRARLAEVVGPDDAGRTPDSVLALVQPTLQLAQLDQGIGALMQQELAEMGAEGAMGGGNRQGCRVAYAGRTGRNRRDGRRNHRTRHEERGCRRHGRRNRGLG